jgi:hypothetical protein
MLNFINEILNISIKISILFFFFKFYFYYKKLMMNLEEIISENLTTTIESSSVPEEDNDEKITEMRERLISIAVSGQSREYFSKNISSAEIEKMSEKDLKKLYSKYETKLGALTSKTIKSHCISAYVGVLGYLLPEKFKIEDKENLKKELNDGPFLSLALSKSSCEIYHKFGCFLAPIEALLLTANNVNLNSNMQLPLKIESLPTGIDETD